MEGPSIERTYMYPSRNPAQTSGRDLGQGLMPDPAEVRRTSGLKEEQRQNGGHSTPEQPITAAELMEIEFAPTNWVVPDVLPEGVTILAAKPKKGKSWMAMGLCEAVAAGGVAFGTKRVDQGDTLYLALEDNPKRLKKRLKKVLDGQGAPEKMYLHTEWPRIDQGGDAALNEWLTEHPDARLVVIDTLAKIRKPVTGGNVYAEDYAALEPLLPIVAKHGVAIVVVYHLRKAGAADPMDEISSSTGLTGGVDGFMILRRLPGSKGPTLFVDGRDIEEPTEYALHWNHNTATWTIEGEAEEVHVSKERANILLVLNRSAEPMTIKEVTADIPDAKYDNIKYLMSKMLQADQLLKDSQSRYSPAYPTNPPHFPHSAHYTNLGKADSYGGNDQVSEVSGVSGVGTSSELPPVEERNTKQGQPQEETRRSPTVSTPRPAGEKPSIATTENREEKPRRRLNIEEEGEVQRLICEGTSPAQARAEVLRESL